MKPPRETGAVDRYQIFIARREPCRTNSRRKSNGRCARGYGNPAARHVSVKRAARVVGTPMPAKVPAVVKFGESANTLAVAIFASGMRPSAARDAAKTQCATLNPGLDRIARRAALTA